MESSENINDLIENLSIYFKTMSEPTSGLEFIAIIVCPIVATIAIIVGGGFALYRYRRSQNYDINLKILNEVYLPLYEYIVKQETFRFIACPEITWEQAPILEITNTKTKRTIDKDGTVKVNEETVAVCGCTRDSLIDVCDNANLGLASEELVTLLNTYKVLNYIMNKSGEGEQREKTAKMREKVEYELRKEILRGYKFYHDKLKLANGETDLYTLDKEQINFSAKL